jgi:ubiquinone/menaquinone biosynthesis C-methylase UbiE
MSRHPPIRSPKRNRSVSAQAFRVGYLRRSRELYRRFLERKPWISQLYRQFLGLRPGLRIVDVGCGTGDFTRYLVRLCSGRCTAIGVDNRKPSLQAAIGDTRREGLAKQISYKLGDALSVPIEDDYSDLTCCRTVLMHLKDPQKAVSEMTRVTKPGGLIAAIEGGRMVSFVDPRDEEYTELSYETNQAWLRAIKKLEGKEFKIGERLPSIFQETGLYDIQSEIHADAWLYCDPRRRLRDIKAELRFESSLSRESRRRDRNYLEKGGLSRANINRYYRKYDRRVKELLSDDKKLRTDASFYGATFVLVTGRKGP